MIEKDLKVANIPGRMLILTGCRKVIFLSNSDDIYFWGRHFSEGWSERFLWKDVIRVI